MGELNRNDAAAKRERHMEKLEKAGRHVREDFEEMDFANAKERERMEVHVERIEEKLSWLARILGGMEFE